MAIPEILLIEDRQDDRELFAAALLVSGVRARLTCAADAIEAVVRLNRLGAVNGSTLPALIVLDLGLPGLKGQTLLQVIRTAYGPREVAIIVLTGSQRPADKDICSTWAISDYMVKPQNYADLVGWVRTLGRFLPSEDESHDARRRTATSLGEPSPQGDRKP
ncbi:MAG: response regulator [Planctomycetes bacterium]|nr:response regulator [Planctomycetota bacterium]